MAAKVPLNKFKNLFCNGVVITTDSDPLSAIYTASDQRATIVIQAQATNPTDKEQIAFLRVRSSSFGGGERDFAIAENVLIPPYDTKSLITGRLVLQGIDGVNILQPDILLYGASDEKVTLSLGLLETKNTD